MPTLPTLSTQRTLSPASDAFSEARAAGAVQCLQKPFLAKIFLEWRGTSTRAFWAGTGRLSVLVQSDMLTDGDQPVGTGLLCLPGLTQGPLSLPLQPWASSARMSTWRSRESRGSSRESTSAAPPTMSQRPSSSESKSPSTVSARGPSGDRGGVERVTMLPYKGEALGSEAHKGPMRDRRQQFF